MAGNMMIFWAVLAAIVAGLHIMHSSAGRREAEPVRIPVRDDPQDKPRRIPVKTKPW